MKKTLVMVLALLMLVMSMSFAMADDKIVVTFWNGWTGADGDVLIEKVEEFNKTNPYNIYIDMDINAEFLTKIQASFAGDNGPAMILGAHSYKNEYPSYLIDMNEIWEKTDLNREDFVSGYLDLCSKNGILYVIPFQVTGRYMYWNKDLFEAAGLDPDVPPTSYEEWAEMAAKITNEDMNVYGSGLSYTEIFTNLQLVQRMGGLFITEDEDGKFVANFKDNEGYAQFLQWFKDMTVKGDNPIETDTASMFYAGQIGITPSGAWLSAGSEAAEINYGVAQLPYGAAGPMNPCSISGFSITKYATEEQKDAAMKFIEWWHNGYETTEETGVMAWSVRCGFPSYYLPCINSEAYQASEKLRLMTCTDNEAKSTYMGPDDFSKTFQLAQDVIQVMIEDVITGNMDPYAALEKAQAAADPLCD